MLGEPHSLGTVGRGRGGGRIPDDALAVTQRLATLRRTTAAATLQDRLRATVEQAVAEAEQELGSDPQAEVAAALIAVDDSVGQPAAAEISEAELIAAADVAKRSSRRARRQLNAR